MSLVCMFCQNSLFTLKSYSGDNLWVIWYPDVCIHKVILDKGVGNGFIKVLTVGENWEGKKFDGASSKSAVNF